MNLLKFRPFWVLIGYGLVLLVVVLSIYPKAPPSLFFTWQDKLQHALAYGVLMLWFAQLHPKSHYLWLACVFIVLGILMEFLQSLLGTRTGDIWDVVANSVGTVLSYGLASTGMNTFLHQLEDWYLKPRRGN
jgi:VanZ family protein